MSVNLEFKHAFLHRAGRILDSGQTRSLVLSGNVHDLKYLSPDHAGDDHTDGRFVSLEQYLQAQWTTAKHTNTVLLICETNGLIRFGRPGDRAMLRRAWEHAQPAPIEVESNDPGSLFTDRIHRTVDRLAGREAPKKKATTSKFDEYLARAHGKPAVALRLLHKLCELSRKAGAGSPLKNKRLLILIESADMIVPEAEITRLNEADRHRVTLMQDWFSDPDFMHGKDSVIVITESRSLVNHRIARLPQIMEVEIPAPDEAARRQFIEWYDATQEGELNLWGSTQELAAFSAGLSLHALHQLLTGSTHNGGELTQKDVIVRVQQYIESQLGEGVVEFLVPKHRLKDLIGNRILKKYLEEELIPILRTTDPDVAIPGFAVAGPIRSGKTFIFEAVAAELGIPVLVLKNLRRKWFGQTDVILERLRRVLKSLSKVMIFVDEADTVLGGIGPNQHATERRLTGTIQGWMSDPQFLGKVVWCLMTARIHLLSPDIRGPGRIDLIIPVTDPKDDDHAEFLEFTIKAALERMPATGTPNRQKIDAATEGYSAGAFIALRRKLKATKIDKGDDLTPDEAVAIIHRQLQPDIGATRRYQLLQALVNTTDRLLMPDPNFTDKDKEGWVQEIRELEARGIR